MQSSSAAAAATSPATPLNRHLLTSTSTSNQTKIPQNFSKKTETFAEESFFQHNPGKKKNKPIIVLRKSHHFECQPILNADASKELFNLCVGMS
jgi:hypothetical protein